MTRFCVVLALIVGLMLGQPVRAEHTSEEARTFIQELAQQAVAGVAERQISDSERNERFRRLFVSAFDLPEISRFMLARYWRSATPEQQQEFIKLFEDIQVLNWAHWFKDTKGVSLVVTASAQESESRFNVDSRMNRPAGQPVPVQWRVRQTDDGHLRITDIVVDGVSMSITQRSDYNSLLQSNGGNFDALLKALRTKIDEMRANG